MHQYGLWAKEETQTTGTGSLALDGAVAGFATFASQIPDGQDLLYCIVAGDDREIGIGTLSAGGTQLARTTVRATLVAGAFNDSTPTQITLPAGVAEVMSTDDATLLEWAEGLRSNPGSVGEVPVVGGDGILALADEIGGETF